MHPVGAQQLPASPTWFSRSVQLLRPYHVVVRRCSIAMPTIIAKTCNIPRRDRARTPAPRLLEAHPRVCRPDPSRDAVPLPGPHPIPRDTPLWRMEIRERLFRSVRISNLQPLISNRPSGQVLVAPGHSGDPFGTESTVPSPLIGALWPLGVMRGDIDVTGGLRTECRARWCPGTRAHRCAGRR
jgi:hypothetical protein